MKTDKRNAPIAVIDSGIGGVSVLIELLKIMPNENYIYFGDSANAPYGIKTHEKVLSIMLENTEKLIGMGAKAIVVACNTATGAAVRVMREKHPDVPIVGIEPALKPAFEVCENPTVAVMATPLTLKEEKFLRLKSRFEDSGEILSIPCPGLMEIIEGGSTDRKTVDDYIKNVFLPYKDKKIDAVVLGCTHYSFIREAVEKYFGNDTRVLDGAGGTAREACRRIKEAGLENTKYGECDVKYINTKEDRKMTEYCKALVEKYL